VQADLSEVYIHVLACPCSGVCHTLNRPRMQAVPTCTVRSSAETVPTREHMRPQNPAPPRPTPPLPVTASVPSPRPPRAHARSSRLWRKARKRRQCTSGPGATAFCPHGAHRRCIVPRPRMPACSAPRHCCPLALLLSRVSVRAARALVGGVVQRAACILRATAQHPSHHLASHASSSTPRASPSRAAAARTFLAGMVVRF
jgi:hypothetical protein